MTTKLTPKQQKKYRDLLQTALQKAGGYRGSEAQLNAFYNPLKQVERLIFINQGLPPTPSIEKSFALAAGIPDEDFRSFNDILQHATDAFNTAANTGAADLESMLVFLEQNGAKVLRGTDKQPDFIPTMDGYLKKPKNFNPKTYKRVFQPRLLWLSQGLESIGVYSDDLTIHVRTVDSNKLRQTPYILVEIPRHKKQIILANQCGEITFVADDCFELSMWKLLNKYQLKTLPSVTPVILRDKDIWLNTILALVQGDAGLKPGTPKINLNKDAQSPKRTKAPYSVAMITESLQATQELTGRWANTDIGLIEHGPLGNGTRTWASVNHAIRSIWRENNPLLSSSGLTRENCPNANLADLKKQKRLNNDYTAQDIIESLKATHKATGEWASKDTGLIEHGPLGNETRTWVSINRAMRSVWRENNPLLSSSGLTRENCPYVSLADLKDKNVINDDYTTQTIIESLKATYKATGEWPNNKTGLIEHGPLANGKRTWVSVDAAKRSIWTENNPVLSCSGLTRENCPYANLADLKKQKRLNNDYTAQDIIESLKATHKATGEWANKDTGLIEHGPLGNETRTWKSVNDAMRAIWRENNPCPSSSGLTPENCPYPSLAQLKNAFFSSQESLHSVPAPN